MVWSINKVKNSMFKDLKPVNIPGRDTIYYPGIPYLKDFSLALDRSHGFKLNFVFEGEVVGQLNIQTILDQLKSERHPEDLFRDWFLDDKIQTRCLLAGENFIFSFGSDGTSHHYFRTGIGKFTSELKRIVGEIRS